jgi:L-arabinose isomerase
MPALPVAHAVWQPRPDIRTALESWLTSGGPHHTALSTTVDLEAMGDLAHILRTELVVIDEHTSSRTFADQLRWNQAYYRLAQPL